MKNSKCFSCWNANFFEVIKRFAKFLCLSSYQNDFESKWPVFIPPWVNESIESNESFCVGCIITFYVTVVLLLKDGSNTLHVILTCILLFTLFRCYCISIIVLTRWIGWLKQQQWPKIRFTFFLFCNTTCLVYT